MFSFLFWFSNEFFPDYPVYGSYMKIFRKTLSKSPLMSPFLKTPSQGAQTTLYCALSNELDDAKFNGKYFADGKECSPHNNFTYNEQNAKRAADLWKISEEITNSKLN